MKKESCLSDDIRREIWTFLSKKVMTVNSIRDFTFKILHEDFIFRRTKMMQYKGNKQSNNYFYHNEKWEITSS